MPRSIASSIRSCRCSSDWLRRARLRNTLLTPLRNSAWPTAASTAVRCTAQKASAILATSRVLVRRASGGASAATSTSSPRRSRLTTAGSRSSASARTAMQQPRQLAGDAVAETAAAAAPR